MQQHSPDPSALQARLIACLEVARVTRQIGYGAPLFPQIAVRHPAELNRRVGYRLSEGSHLFPVFPALPQFAPVQRFPEEVKQREFGAFAMTVPKLVQPEI